jgi:hypothetical protein
VSIGQAYDLAAALDKTWPAYNPLSHSFAFGPLMSKPLSSTQRYFESFGPLEECCPNSIS